MDVKITELEHLLTKNLQVIEDLKGGVDTMKKAMKDIKVWLK